MSGSDILALVSILVTFLLGLLVYRTNRSANRTSEKKLTLEEQQADAEEDDRIAARRLEEIDRLDRLVKSLREDVDRLAKTVRDLEDRDREKQRVIDRQAGELDRTNRRLTEVRRLFSRFVERVEQAWEAGHQMPTLTPEERALLEEDNPTYRTKETP